MNHSSPWDGPLADRLAGLLDPHHRRVLQMGCTDGALVEHLAALGYRVTGVDPDAAALPADHDAVRYLAAPLEGLPFRPQAFDTVLFVGSLHRGDPELALAQARRVVRRHGRVVVVDAVRWAGRREERYLLERLLPGVTWRRLRGRRYLAVWDKRGSRRAGG